MAWLPIEYRDFYDIPRAFIVEYLGELYFFDCPFDEDNDEYPNYFSVYQLPIATIERYETGSWIHLKDKGDLMGTISTNALKFDESRRRYIDETAFKQMTHLVGRR